MRLGRLILRSFIRFPLLRKATFLAAFSCTPAYIALPALGPDNHFLEVVRNSSLSWLDNSASKFALTLVSRAGKASVTGQTQLTLPQRPAMLSRCLQCPFASVYQRIFPDFYGQKTAFFSLNYIMLNLG